MDNNLSNFSPLHSGRQKRGWGPGWRDTIAGWQFLRRTFTANVWWDGTVAKLSLWLRVVSKRQGWGRLKDARCCSAPGDSPIQRPPQKLSYPAQLKLSLPKSHLHSYSCCFLLAAPTFEPYCGSLYPCWDAFRDSLLGSATHDVESVLYDLIKAKFLSVS